MVLDGEQGELLRAFKYSSAQAFAKDLSYRVSQAQMRSLAEGRKTTTSIFPWACDKLVRSPAGVPLFRIRDRRDGTQAKLHVETSAVIDVYGTVGGRTGRWRKQKDDRVEWVPGSAAEQALVLDLYRWHYGEGLGSRRIARRLAEQDRQREGGKQWLETRVTQLLDSEVYCGYTIGLAAIRGMYNGLSDGEPRRVDRPDEVYLNERSMPIIYRPPEEAYRQEHLGMRDFFAPDVRERAEADHERRRRQRYQTSLLPPGQKKHGRGNSNRGSAHLLSGLLRREDGEVLVGVRCGPPGKPKRYYRVKGGRSDFAGDKRRRRMVAAEPLERAVLEEVRAAILSRGDLREELSRCVRAELDLVESGSRRLKEAAAARAEKEVRIEETIANFQGGAARRGAA